MSWLLLVLAHAGVAYGQLNAGDEEAPVVLSYGWLGDERAAFCAEAPTQPAQLDEQESYVPAVPEEQEGHDARILVQSWRTENLLKPVMQQCSLAKDKSYEEMSDQCNAALQEYAGTLMMFGSPVVLVFITLIVWNVCCWVSCCRCCRRCCLCAERKGPREARVWQRMVVVLTVFICTCVILFTASVAYSRSNQVADGIADMLCQMLTMADETLNGSNQNPIFLGIDVGIHKIQKLRRLLDEDGRAMTDVRAILDMTANFGAAMDDVLMKITHMERVLTIVGQRKIKEHTCVFCKLAVGNNATGEVGLLKELQYEIQRSSADAMRSIQNMVSSTLTGRPLVEVSTAVQRGGTALQVFKKGYAGTLVEGAASYKGTIQTFEDSRHTIFMTICGFCIVHALFVNLASVWYAKSSKAKYPSPTPSCLTWFCAFCSLTFALTFAGAMTLMVVPLSEACDWWRYDLLTYEGIQEYHQQMGFVMDQAIMDPLAVDIARTCLTPNGTGDILGALQLRERLRFQEVLDNKFVELEDKMAGRVVDIAKFELLVSRSRSYGGLFILDPDDPLPLEPNAAPRMLGSSLDPDDQQGPADDSQHAGLNTYASLIQGPGRFSFLHGTAGGGTLITATRPTEAEMSGMALQTQNALIYARLKEQILSEPGIFRCDVLDSRYHVTERTCGFEEYRTTVLQWATEVREAGIRLGKEAEQAKQLIASDLKTSLRAVLIEVKELSTLFHCRFLWKRWEDFDFYLCNQAMPGMLEGSVVWMTLAMFTLVLFIVHYKIWRHFLDNKVVGVELERFSKKYGYLKDDKAKA